MHLLCSNIELPFAVYNVKACYFREQYPLCQSPCRALAHTAGMIQHTDFHQEHICCRWRKLIGSSFVLSSLTQGPVSNEVKPHHALYPSETQGLYVCFSI